ncbi:MAG: hypothetical protein ACFN0X_08055 [Mitsuokella sp.]
MTSHARKRELVHACTFAEAAFPFRDERANVPIGLFGDTTILDVITEGIAAEEAFPSNHAEASEIVALEDSGILAALAAQERFGVHETGFAIAGNGNEGLGLCDAAEIHVNRIACTDAFGIADAAEIRINRIDIRDGIAVADGMVRASGAVLSDVGVRAPLRASEFEALVQHPAGYAPFRLFHVGDYEYQDAIVRVTMQAGSLGTVPEIYGMVMHVDIDDTVSRGLAHLTAGDNFVAYGKPYYTRPEVTATLRGGYGGDKGVSVIVDGIDTTGFHVRLEKADGNDAAGVISWTAIGY